MNNSRVVFKRGWLLPLAVISIAFMALAFGAATSNKAEAQSGGPGNGGEGGGGHDLGAWEHCVVTGPEPDFGGATTVALAKLNARGGGHNYTLVQTIACGIQSKVSGSDHGNDPCDDFLIAFRFTVDDLGTGTRSEKNVTVCHE